MTPELETLEQLDGSNMRLSVIRGLYPNVAAFKHGVHGLLKIGDCRLLDNGADVPEWRWRELFEDHSDVEKLGSLTLAITDQGTKRFG